MVDQYKLDGVGVEADVVASNAGAPTSKNVSWLDLHGQDLYMVREFEPSDNEDDASESEELQHHRQGCCTIM